MNKRIDDSRQTAGSGKPMLKAVAAPVVEMFSDKRSGRERREDESIEVAESRRENSDRRRGNIRQGAWWLLRDYVESHHFVQKSSRSRDRVRADDE